MLKLLDGEVPPPPTTADQQMRDLTGSYLSDITFSDPLRQQHTKEARPHLISHLTTVVGGGVGGGNYCKNTVVFLDKSSFAVNAAKPEWSFLNRCPPHAHTHILRKSSRIRTLGPLPRFRSPRCCSGSPPARPLFGATPPPRGDSGFGAPSLPLPRL